MGLHNLIAAGLLGAALTFAITSAHAGEPVTITNFVAGAVCGSGKDARVCFDSQDVQITNEGRCVFNGKNIRCTWYGYSFDYTLAPGKDSAELDCVAQSSEPDEVGNPTAILAKSATRVPYKITLRGAKGHFFNPQYTAAISTDGTVSHYKQSCSYEGKELFQAELRLHYPQR